MTERDRLIELLNADMSGCDGDYAEELADYLIANGVIVPPCKVYDTVWAIENPLTRKLLKKTDRSLRQWCEEVFSRFICECAFRYPQNQRDNRLRDQSYWGDHLFYPRGSR